MDNTQTKCLFGGTWYWEGYGLGRVLEGHGNVRGEVLGESPH